MSKVKQPPKQTQEERLEILEQRIAQLESWTGADADGNPMNDKAPVIETLLAQEKIIRHLLRLLDFLGPDFSIARFRKSLKMADETGIDTLSSAWDTEFARSIETVIERLIPVPLPRDQPRSKRPGGFRPTLVPKVPDGDDDA